MKRKNRKHEGEYLWTFPQRLNKDNTEYYACQYVTIEDGTIKTVTRGLGVKGTTEYRANLAKHEKLAKKSLKARLNGTMSGL